MKEKEHRLAGLPIRLSQIAVHAPADLGFEAGMSAAETYNMHMFAGNDGRKIGKNVGRLRIKTPTAQGNVSQGPLGRLGLD